MIVQLRFKKILEHGVRTPLQTLPLDELVNLAVYKKKERFAPKGRLPLGVALQPKGELFRKIEPFEGRFLPLCNRLFQRIVFAEGMQQ